MAEGVMPPSGTLTFLLTDIEGSSRLWERHEPEMDAALAQHDQIMRSTISGHGGYVFSTSGDAFAAAFERASEAIAAARSAQERLAAASWPTQVPVEVRMGLHTGEAIERGGDYFGPVVNRAARVMAAGHGGQTIVSSTTAALAGPSCLIDLGEHRLKDLGAPEQLFQLDGPRRRFPPLRTLSAVRNNLPVSRARLFGREREIEQLMELLASSRLVTLTGVGGVGKTRLAVSVAAEAAEVFADGVFFVDLTALCSGGQLVGRVAETLGLERGGRLDERLLEYLAHRRVLVVLDNCEHLVDDVAEFVDQVLDAEGSAQLLATSREHLGVEGERVVRVASLPVGSVDGSEAAIGLLVDRAASIGVELGATGDASHELWEICARLDGIPLAIELAAAQLVHFRPQDLLDRLDQRFDLLSGGRGRRRQRQQTLQAVMDWSWGLLDEDEQALLARLAVLAGVWGLEDAEGICGIAGEAGPVSTIGSLVSKSLVQLVDDGETARFRLLETVRLYAQQKLVDRGEADDLRSRHLSWFVDHARGGEFESNVLSLTHVAWYRQSFDNIRLAIEWAMTVGDHDAAATLVIAGSAQTTFGGQIGGIDRDLIDHAERLVDHVDDPTTQARLLVAQAWMGWGNNDVQIIHRAADRAIEVARRADDVNALVMALAFATFYRDDQEAWSASLAEARAAAARSDSTLAASLADAFLDGAHYRWADVERLAVEAPRRVHRHDVATVVDITNLHTTNSAAMVIGDPELASWAVEQRIALNHEFGIPLDWADWFDRALIAAMRGDLEPARASLHEANRLDLSGRVGPPKGEFLLVPAVIADRQNRPHDCAVLLAIIRAQPVPLHDGNSIGIYRSLRRRVQVLLTEEELGSAEREAERLSVQSVLAAFLSRSPHEA